VIGIYLTLQNRYRRFDDAMASSQVAHLWLAHSLRS